MPVELPASLIDLRSSDEITNSCAELLSPEPCNIGAKAVCLAKGAAAGLPACSGRWQVLRRPTARLPLCPRQARSSEGSFHFFPLPEAAYSLALFLFPFADPVLETPLFNRPVVRVEIRAPVSSRASQRERACLPATKVARFGHPDAFCFGKRHQTPQIVLQHSHLLR